jgi:hypothetical protein
VDEGLVRKVVYEFLNEDLKVQNISTDRDYDIWWWSNTPHAIPPTLLQQDNEDESETYFHSEGHVFTVMESLEYLITQYIILILVTLFTFAYAYTKLNRCLKTRRQQSLVSKLFKLVKTELRDKVGSISGLSQADILRLYLRMPKDVKDGLKRDEETFYKQLWPRLEGERVRDRSIKRYERMQFGREVPVWTQN